MKFLVLAWLLLLAPGALYAQQPAASGAGQLCWHERKLQWGDFQAKASELKDSLASAYAAPELHVQGFVDEKGNNNFLVRASFNQRRAWEGTPQS